MITENVEAVLPSSLLLRASMHVCSRWRMAVAGQVLVLFSDCVGQKAAVVDVGRASPSGGETMLPREPSSWRKTGKG